MGASTRSSLLFIRIRSGLIAWAVVTCCALLLALSDLRFPFLWDDYELLGRATSLSLRDVLPDPSIIFYRPLSREVYFWTIAHPLGMSPLAAHLLNAAVASALVGALIVLMAGIAGLPAAVLAGLLFACSASVPLVIGWVSASQDLLCALFIAMAFVLQVRRMPVASALAMAGALLSKETAIAAIPASIALAIALPGRSRASLVRSLGANALVGIAWALIHPWTRQVLSGSNAAASSREYIGFHGGTLLSETIRGIGLTLNIPWVGGSAQWPANLVLPALLVTGIALILLLRGGGQRYSTEAASRGPALAILAGGLLFVGSVVLTSLLLGRWSPHYAFIPALGLCMALGQMLARFPRHIHFGAVALYLWLGIGLRGAPFGPVDPTEPNFREAAAALRKVERGFKSLHPKLAPNSNVYVSVQARGGAGLYRHILRFQALRTWYKEPGLWVLDPNRRRPGGPNEYLFWIAPDFNVYEIRLTDLSPRGPTDKIDLPQYQKTLRGYAMGLAGAGDVERGAFILANMPQTSREIAAFDRRGAAALLIARGRDAEAQKLLEGVPEFPRPQAIEAVVALLAEPVTGLDLDRGAMLAFGLKPDDIPTLRILMGRFESSGYNVAAVRFAEHLQSRVPGDSESASVIARLKLNLPRPILVPIPHDIPQ